MSRAFFPVALFLLLPMSSGGFAQPAPAGKATTRYCMSVEAATGSRVEKIVCWTRDRWAAQGVDVDAEWAREGVRVID